MTTLDQIRLLEEKVENAVAKLQQLQAENDALRNKCAELTNALESKTEQLLSFTTNKEQIEEGIKNALDRLNFIESSVLGSGSPTPDGQGSIHITPGAGLSSLEPITEEVPPNNDSPAVSESPAITESPSYNYTETPVSNPSENEANGAELNQQLANNSSEFTASGVSFARPEQVSGPNFNTMETIQSQPEAADGENPAIKNDDNEGDQDAFEYDIF